MICIVMMKKEGSKAFYYFQFSRAHCVKDSRGEVVKDVCLVTPKDILQFSNLFAMEWSKFILRLLFFVCWYICIFFMSSTCVFIDKHTHHIKLSKNKRMMLDEIPRIFRTFDNHNRSFPNFEAFCWNISSCIYLFFSEE